MSISGENSPLSLDALTDEIIALHRLATPQQPVAGAVQDFVRRLGRDREGMVLRELIAERIRRRVDERLQEAARRPFPPAAPKPRPAAVPLRIPPTTSSPFDLEIPEIPEVPEPESAEELKPNAVLWHSTQSDGYEDQEPEAVVAPVPLTKFSQPVTEAPPAPLPVPVPRPALAVQQPSSRLAAMRSMTAEETWGALADMVDIGGGIRKKRIELTRDDLTAVMEFAAADEREAAKQLSEANRAKRKAWGELNALRRHNAEKIGDLPDAELDRLYGQRAA